MKPYLIFSLLLLWSANVFSQTGQLSGNVKNSNNDILSGATVRLVRLPDSSLVKTSISDESGKFQFSNLGRSAYFLVITATGQKRYFSPKFSIDSVTGSIVLPVIIMQPSQSQSLAEVVVKAKRPLLVQEIDRTVVNVDAMISSATSNTLEVLEKTPGITVGMNGEISLNGRAGVLVLIDGRPTFMSAQDLAAYLKSLPGGLIDRLELMDNPPARYDASGSAVIDIRLKKKRTAGYTGSFSSGYSQGRYGRTNESLNFNFNHRKFNVFANLGYNQEKNYNANRMDRNFYDAAGSLSSMASILNNEILKSKSINLNVGLDLPLSKKTTIGFQANINSGEITGAQSSATASFNRMSQPDSTGMLANNGAGERRNLGTNFNFLQKLNGRGAEFTADFNYNRYRQEREHSILSQVFDKTGNFSSDGQLFYLIPSDIRIYTAKADLIFPIRGKMRLEAGYKSSIVENEHISDNYTVNGNVYLKDNRLSNHFIYKENINAAYVTLQKSYKRFGAQLGLRLENTLADGEQLGNSSVAGSKFSRNYTGLFPVSFISYKLDTLNRNSFNLSFSRRISRPNYQMLNPFLYFRDQFSYTTGNPMLSPQYQSRIELKFQHKQLLTMGLSYNRFTKVIFQTTQAVDNILISKPDNVSSGFMVILNTTLSAGLTKWWTTNTTLRLSALGLNGEVYNEQLNPRANIARLELNNSFDISKTVKAELNG
ncbi:MAG: outer membrane beta-barrel protein, partial [Gemmatimonadaceae bacterium]|nr:outer membrane beta-barrel protein [Chitinophagaceae bacterium]